jgi:sulfur carrier protein
LIINGEKMDVDEISIMELIKKFNQKSENIVIEVNGEIIKKSFFDEFILSKTDKIEIIAFVGGG